jgi:proton glutamate symport protein
MKRFQLSPKILLKPATLMASLVIAVLMGIFAPEFSVKLGAFGKIFVALLQMTVIPVLITAVASSLGRIVETHGLTRKLLRIVIVFLVGLAGSTLTGLFFGLIFRPGDFITKGGQSALGAYLFDQEFSNTSAETGHFSFFEFVTSIVPVNPAAAISSGNYLAILFFSILLGVALGFVASKQAREVTLQVLETIYDAQLRIIHWTLHAMPLGILCIFSDQIARTGFHLILALLKFVVITIAAVLLSVLVHLYLVHLRKPRKSFLQVFSQLKTPYLIAFTTRSSFATIPSALKTMVDGLRRNEQDVRLVIPLSINLNRMGSSMYMALSATLFLQIYDVPFSLAQMALITVVCIFSGMIPSNIAGLVPLVFAPLGLPIEVVLMLLLAIDPIIDPFLTLMNVSGSCVATQYLSDRGSG